MCGNVQTDSVPKRWFSKILAQTTSFDVVTLRRLIVWGFEYYQRYKKQRIAIERYILPVLLNNKKVAACAIDILVFLKFECLLFHVVQLNRFIGTNAFG